MTTNRNKDEAKRAAEAMVGQMVSRNGPIVSCGIAVDISYTGGEWVVIYEGSDGTKYASVPDFLEVVGSGSVVEQDLLEADPDLVERPDSKTPFGIGSDVMPGTAKVLEEMGELQEVLSKLVAMGGAPVHYDGTNLLDRLCEEIADVQAAIHYFSNHSLSPNQRHWVDTRRRNKFERFRQWHFDVQNGIGASND